jgi:periplasmic protein TonB
MFDDALLDSASARAPVLEGFHYTLAAAVGALGFLAAYAALRLFFVLPETRMAAFVATAFGAALLCSALMPCYVWVDTRRRGWNVAAWVSVTLALNLAGFVFYLIYSAARTGSWKRATIPLAYVLQVALVGVLVLIPLIHAEALPKTWLWHAVVSAPPPPAAPAAPTAKRAAQKFIPAEKLIAPIKIPTSIAQIHDEPLPAEGEAQLTPGVPGGIPGGSFSGVPGGIIGIGPWSPPPPPPPTPKSQKPRMIRLGGIITAAKAVYQPKPDYPPLARMARVQGQVVLEAIIAKDGSIRELRALSGHPLLVKAALDAVQHWRYLPTLLDGEPVEVLTEIDVNFWLAE